MILHFLDNKITKDNSCLGISCIMTTYQLRLCKILARFFTRAGRLEHQGMSQFRLVSRKITRMAGYYNCLIIWNVYILHVVFVGRLVCSVNVLYMELSYTGSVDRSTRASEHVTLQISLPVRLPGWQVFIILFDLLEWVYCVYCACGLCW